MFREPKGKNLFYMDRLSAATSEADEVNMDVQKGSGAKDTSVPLYSANHTISVAAPKPLSSNMVSRYVLPTKKPSFE